MKATWKGNPIGELDLEDGLTVREMLRVEAEFPEFKNPLVLLSAAIDITIPGPVVLDDDGKPKTDADGKPRRSAVPNPDWDPRAFALLVSILHHRVGIPLDPEDVDGFPRHLQLESSEKERAMIRAAAEAEGKGAGPEPTVTAEPGPPAASEPGSGDTPPDSGSTTG